MNNTNTIKYQTFYSEMATYAFTFFTVYTAIKYMLQQRVYYGFISHPMFLSWFTLRRSQQLGYITSSGRIINE